FGVPAGATRDSQATASTPSIPEDASGGTPGTKGEVAFEVRAIALTLPARTCGRADPAITVIMLTRPATTSVIAGPAPLYGTWTISTPVTVLRSSIVRWE